MRRPPLRDRPLKLKEEDRGRADEDPYGAGGRPARRQPRRRGVNADVPGSVLRARPWRLPSSATTTLDRALERGALSLRGYDRTLRCAWTIADVLGLQRPGRDQVDLALSLRHRAGVAA